MKQVESALNCRSSSCLNREKKDAICFGQIRQKTTVLTEFASKIALD